ncbi:hypothetical protein [Haloferax marisrubri]|uniref:hypothetical protein n=1 Tax=Haloferax marisrubri TaxID=1544719 RepID=UPI000A696543|nr:hypothetical protein [Haloferax marisrubri]
MPGENQAGQLKETFRSINYVNGLIRSYNLDESAVTRYRQRKQFKKWADWFAYGLIIATGIIIYFASRFGYTSEGEITGQFLFAAMGSFSLASVFALVSLGFQLALLGSELDDEIVACHDLAEAFDSFRRSDPLDVEEIEHHLVSARNSIEVPGLLSRPHAEKIPYDLRKEIIQYIDRFETARDQEQVLNNSFSQFVEYVSAGIVPKDGSVINELSKDIELDPTHRPTKVEGLKREISGVKNGLLSGSIGIVFVGVMITAVSYPFIGLGNSLGLGAFVMTGYGFIRGS